MYIYAIINHTFDKNSKTGTNKIYSMKKLFLLKLLSVALLASVLLMVSCGKDEDEPNKNPTITSVTVTPGSVAAGGTATIIVSATDPDGDALTYTYIASGGTVVPQGATATWTAPGTAGGFSVTVTVNDGKGGTATSAGTLTVTGGGGGGGNVSGTASFSAGTAGDLQNAKVSLYLTLDDWNNNVPIKWGAVAGSGANVTFTLSSVNPGNYYLDVWKDNDFSAFWSVGDYVGWYGSGGLGAPSLTPFQLANGGNFSCAINMYLIAKSSQIKKL
jgi:hypothetical protein